MNLSLPNSPNLLTTVRLMAAGIAGYMAIQTVIFMYYGQRRRLYTYFLGMCIIATATLMVEAHLGEEKSIPDTTYLLQWQFAFVLAFIPMLYGFIAIYVGQLRHQFWQRLLAAFTAGLIILNFTITPFSLRFSKLDIFFNYKLPWGDAMTWYVGTPSIWYFVATTLIAMLLVWAIVQAGNLFYTNRHRSAPVLICALTFALLTLSLGVLKALGYVQFMFLGGIGVLGLLLFMSAALALEMQESNLALKATAKDLQEKITLHQCAEERIRHMAYHDYVTDLPNRVKLRELLQEALARSAETGRKGAMILLDLDDFKTINDVLGHSFGDRLLQLVGERLLALVQDGGTLAHLGGDEFVVLLRDVGRDEKEGEKVAQHTAGKNIEALTTTPFSLAGHSIEVSASAGIALFPEEDENETGFLQRVDIARDRAKAVGRGSIQLYAADMRTEMHERLQLERDMRKGIERGEFKVYFQPQVDLAGDIVGAEALLRWQHPTRGLVSPAVFIPIAEQSGLISQLGEWTLQQVCRQIKAWKQSLPFFKGHLSVNISAWQFMQRDFKEDVRCCLAESGIDAARLTIEITESAFLGDMEDAIATIRFLRSHGMRVSIDDFGTGYSSLSYLRRLPVDELKIDQAFARNLGTDLRDTHLVETIIDIGKCMEMQVVAEGVETESQRDLLAKMDCWALQGYWLAPPMDQEAFSDWLVRRYDGMSVSMAK